MPGSIDEAIWRVESFWRRERSLEALLALAEAFPVPEYSAAEALLRDLEELLSAPPTSAPWMPGMEEARECLQGQVEDSHQASQPGAILTRLRRNPRFGWLVEEVDQLLKDGEGALRIAVLGVFSAGKSSLINAIVDPYLSDSLLPVGLEPKTATYTEIRWGVAPRLLRVRGDVEVEVPWNSRERVLTEDPRSGDHYVVEYPSDALRGLVLVDTPGLNSETRQHIQQTERELARCEAALWVFNTTKAGSEVDRERLAQLTALIGPSIGVLNKIDVVTPRYARRKGREQWRANVESVVRDQAARFDGLIHAWAPVSGKWRIENALGMHDEQDVPPDGFSALMAALAQLGRQVEVRRRKTRERKRAQARRLLHGWEALGRKEQERLALARESRRQEVRRNLAEFRTDWEEEVLLYGKGPPRASVDLDGPAVVALHRAVRCRRFNPALRQALLSAWQAMDVLAQVLRSDAGSTWANGLRRIARHQRNASPDEGFWSDGLGPECGGSVPVSEAVRDLVGRGDRALAALAGTSSDEGTKLLWPVDGVGLEEAASAGSMEAALPLMGAVVRRKHERELHDVLSKVWRNRLGDPAVRVAAASARLAEEPLLPEEAEEAKRVIAYLDPGGDLSSVLLVAKGRGIAAMLGTLDRYGGSGDQAVRQREVLEAVRDAPERLPGIDMRGVFRRLARAPLAMARLVLSVAVGGALLAGGGIAVLTVNQMTSTGEAPPVLLAPGGAVLARIEPGRATLGVTPGGGGDPDENAHEFMLGRPLLVMKTELTQGQWAKVAGRNPVAGRIRVHRGKQTEQRCDELGLGDDLPVHCVDWLDVVGFANLLSDQDGLEPAYDIGVDGVVERIQASSGWRVPTEDEWEFVALADGEYSKDICKVGNVRDELTQDSHPADLAVADCSDGEPGLAQVGRFEANGWGIHDMLGNVWEWTEGGDGPVLRGGSWFNGPDDVRIANRYEVPPNTRSPWAGVRFVRFADRAPERERVAQCASDFNGDDRRDAAVLERRGPDLSLRYTVTEDGQLPVPRGAPVDSLSCSGSYLELAGGGQIIRSWLYTGYGFIEAPVLEGAGLELVRDFSVESPRTPEAAELGDALRNAVRDAAPGLDCTSDKQRPLDSLSRPLTRKEANDVLSLVDCGRGAVAVLRMDRGYQGWIVDADRMDMVVDSDQNGILEVIFTKETRRVGGRSVTAILASFDVFGDARLTNLGEVLRLRGEEVEFTVLYRTGRGKAPRQHRFRCRGGHAEPRCEHLGTRRAPDRIAEPQTADTLHAEGFRALGNGRLDDAAQALTACLELEPDHVGCLWETGWVRWRQEEWEESVRMWERVDELDPDHDEVRVWLPKARASAAEVVEAEH